LILLLLFCFWEEGFLSLNGTLFIFLFFFFFFLFLFSNFFGVLWTILKTSSPRCVCCDVPLIIAMSRTSVEAAKPSTAIRLQKTVNEKAIQIKANTKGVHKGNSIHVLPY